MHVFQFMKWVERAGYNGSLVERSGKYSRIVTSKDKERRSCDSHDVESRQSMKCKTQMSILI